MRLVTISSTLVISAATLLAGCAATVPRDSASVTVTTASTSASKNIVLQLTGPDQVTKSDNWGDFKEEWQSSMSEAAKAKDASFRMGAAGQAPAGPAVLVKLQVNGFKYVSTGKRYGLGVFTGNAFMDIDAQFVEYPGAKLLGTRKYQTSSTAWQGVFSAMTSKQVEAVSKDIVGEVAGK